MVKLCIASILSGASYREKNAAQMLIHHWQVLHPMDVIKPEATSDSFGENTPVSFWRSLIPNIYQWMG